MNLQNLTLDELVSLFITRPEAIVEFYKLCHGVKAGENISLLFNPHRLSTTNARSSGSVFSSLKNDRQLNGMARLLLYNLEHNVSNPFFATIQRGYSNIYYINEFPPIVARNLILKYTSGISGDKYILDPCSGWGGRMIGCASIPNTHYVGFEPSTQSYEGLLKLGEWLKCLQPTFTYEVYKLPYEESEKVLDVNGVFDFALTSPPYYDTENYSDEETNSLNKFDTFEKWVDGFYMPLILLTTKRIKSESSFILNIGDRVYPLTDTMQTVCSNNGLFVKREYDYLSGNGDTKEKFYQISKHPIISEQFLF